MRLRLHHKVAIIGVVGGIALAVHDYANPPNPGTLSSGYGWAGVLTAAAFGLVAVTA